MQFLRYYYDPEYGFSNKDNIEIIAHSADGDVLVLEQVYKYLFNLAKEKAGIDDEEIIIKRMIEISNKPSLIRRFSFGKHIEKLVEEVAQQDRGYLEWFLKTKEEEGTDEDWLYTLKYYLNKK